MRNARPAGALATGVVAAYALPAFSQALIHGPVNGIIQGIYAKDFGLSLASIATVLLVASLCDALVNPLVGYASDVHRERGGSRKPWILAGTGVCMVATWFLYAPSPPVTVGYFLAFLLLAYIGWALVETPHAAWMPEISAEYDERTRLATWRATATYLGVIAFMALPYLPFLESRSFSAESLRWTALVAIVALPAFAVLAVAVVPSGAAQRSSGARGASGAADIAGGTGAPGSAPPVGTKLQWRGIFRNRPLLVFAAAFFLYQLAPGVMNGLLFFYVDTYLGAGPFLAGLMLMTVAAGFVSIPFWGWLCRRIGKHRAWALSCASAAVLIPSLALVPPGEAGLPWLAAIQLGIVVAFAIFPVAAPAVLADVIDYARLRFGADYGGSYFSIYNLLYKSLSNVGGALAIALVGLAGFEPARGAAGQPPGATTALLVVFCAVPALMLAVAVPLIWRFPIDARRQAIVARRLAMRDARARRNSVESR